MRKTKAQKEHEELDQYVTVGLVAIGLVTALSAGLGAAVGSWLASD